MSIDDKVIIVTGASSGIGLATAELLAKKGARVVLTARSIDKLNKISKRLSNSLAIQADMTKPEQISKMIQAVKKHYGRIDVLVNNAGQGYDAPIDRINIQNLEKIFKLDYQGPLIAMQQVIPIMTGQSGGTIINVSSGTALMHLPNMGAYASIKSAIAHLSLTAREELKDKKIVVSVIYPYITLTNFEDNTIKDLEPNSMGQEFGSYQPPKSDSPEYVAQLICNCISSGEAEVFAHDWMKRI